MDVMHALEVVYLVPHDWLLDRSEVLEGGQQDVAPLRSTDIVDEAAELLA